VNSNTNSNNSLNNDAVNFTGIWNRDDKNEHIQAVAETLFEERAEKGGVPERKPKSWAAGKSLLVLGFGILGQSLLLLPFLFFYGGSLEKLLTQPVFILLAGLSLNLSWIVGMWFVSKRYGLNNFRLEYRVFFKKWDVFIGIGFAALGFALIQLVSWILTDLMGLSLKGSDNGAVFAGLEGIWFLLVGIGMVSIIGPASEELIFRGMILKGFTKTFTKMRNVITVTKKTVTPSKFVTKSITVAAILVSSTIFGFMHFQGGETFGQWFLVIATGSLGVIFACMTVWFKRLGPAIFAHMFYNGTTMVIAFMLT
jgi:membrane protease YdiL (CAAX protease family)